MAEQASVDALISLLKKVVDLIPGGETDDLWFEIKEAIETHELNSCVPSPETNTKPSDGILALLDEAADKAFAASISDMTPTNLRRLRAVIDAALPPENHEPAGWFNWNEYHGYQQVAAEYESPPRIPLYKSPPPENHTPAEAVAYGCFDQDILFATFTARSSAEEEAKMHPETEVHALYRHPAPPENHAGCSFSANRLNEGDHGAANAEDQAVHRRLSGFRGTSASLAPDGSCDTDHHDDRIDDLRLTAPTPQQTETNAQPYAWTWTDATGCMFITGDGRKPDVPAHAKPLYEHPASPDNHVRAAILEEAAKVAETGDCYGQFQTAGDERRAKAIAERIRALASTEGQP